MCGFKQWETCILIKGWEIKIKKCGVNAVEGPLRETASSSETWWISSIRTCWNYSQWTRHSGSFPLSVRWAWTLEVTWKSDWKGERPLTRNTRKLETRNVTGPDKFKEWFNFNLYLNSPFELGSDFSCLVLEGTGSKYRLCAKLQFNPWSLFTVVCHADMSVLCNTSETANHGSGHAQNSLWAEPKCLFFCTIHSLLFWPWLVLCL